MKKQYRFNKILGLLLCLGMTMAVFNSCGDKNFWGIIKNIDIDIKVTDITINPPGDVSVAVGKTITLTAIVKPDNAAYKDVTWSSGDYNTATVNDQTGMVTGISAGTTTISAIAMDGSGVVATKRVTVTSGSD